LECSEEGHAKKNVVSFYGEIHGICFCCLRKRDENLYAQFGLITLNASSNCVNNSQAFQKLIA